MALRFGLLLAAGALLGAASSARAVFVLGNGDSINLNTILNSIDRSFQVGDKLFTMGSYTSATVPAANVSVIGFIAANPLDGIGFDLTAGFGDIPGDGTITDLNLHYTVEVLQPQLSQGFRIKDLGLAFNGSAFGPGSVSRVDESVFDPSGIPGTNLIGTRHVFTFGTGASQTQDFQLFANNATYTRLEINKDILFYAVGPNDQAGASFVRQTFSQTPSPAGSTALFLTGSLLLTRRRR